MRMKISIDIYPQEILTEISIENLIPKKSVSKYFYISILNKIRHRACLLECVLGQLCIFVSLAVVNVWSIILLKFNKIDTLEKGYKNNI